MLAEARCLGASKALSCLCASLQLRSGNRTARLRESVVYLAAGLCVCVFVCVGVGVGVSVSVSVSVYVVCVWCRRGGSGGDAVAAGEGRQ